MLAQALDLASPVQSCRVAACCHGDAGRVIQGPWRHDCSGSGGGKPRPELQDPYLRLLLSDSSKESERRVGKIFISSIPSVQYSQK